MTQLVAKPELGSIIGYADSKPVAASDELQRYLDEIQDVLNNFILGDAVILPSYTVANVPDASQWQGGLIYVSNESGGAVPAFSDNTNWRRVTDRTIIS